MYTAGWPTSGAYSHTPHKCRRNHYDPATEDTYVRRQKLAWLPATELTAGTYDIVRSRFASRPSLNRFKPPFAPLLSGKQAERRLTKMPTVVAAVGMMVMTVVLKKGNLYQGPSSITLSFVHERKI